MPFLFLGLFIIVLSILSFFRTRHDRRQNDVEESFWDRESKANHVRRKDISNLSYITIPFYSFSIGSLSDESLCALEQDFLAFREKKMLNLNGQSNTDLKLLYGAANLAALSEYDSNYVAMLQALTAYTTRLIELGHRELAIPVLAFAVRTGSDIPSHYEILATYYKETADTSALAQLRQQANALTSIRKSAILLKIEA